MQWSDGPYEVSRIDVGRQLSHRIDSGGGLGRVNETVVAIGSDDQFVVVKQEDIENNDLEQYYYIVKADDSQSLNAEDIVQGPFSESEFEMIADELGLPEFSKEF